MSSSISEKNIRVKTMCLIEHDGKVLIQSLKSLKSRKPEKNIVQYDTGNIYRVLGGSLNYCEPIEDGVRREIREELGSEISSPKLLTVIDNIFDHKGQRDHEVVFLYKADLVNTELHKKPVIHIVEDTYEFDAEWIPVKKVLNGEVQLVPKTDYSKWLTNL